MGLDPFLQRLVHAGLPTWPIGLEIFDNLAAVSDGNLNLLSDDRRRLCHRDGVSAWERKLLAGVVKNKKISRLIIQRFLRKLSN